MFLQPDNCRELLRWRLPKLPVDARGALALILGHSSYRQRFRAERAGQPPLQCSHPAPVAFLCRLRQANPHEPHVPLNSSPIDGNPVRRGVRGRRIDLLIDYSHCCTSFGMPVEDTAFPEGKTVPFGAIELTSSMQTLDDCCTGWKWARFHVGANLEPLSRPLQPGIRFLHLPIPAPSWASLAGRLPVPTSNRRRVGLATFPAIPTRQVST